MLPPSSRFHTGCGQGLRRPGVHASLTSFLLTVGTISVFGGETQKIIDFRDGTIAKVSMPDVNLPWRRIAEDGEVTEEPFLLSRVKQLRFVLTPATEQVAAVRRMVIQLGDEDYHKREEAQKELLLRGEKFRKILEQMQPRAKDFEVRWRLQEVLNHLPTGKNLVGNDYDQLRIAGQDDEIHGDVGHWNLQVDYRGAKLTIDRESVLAIRDAPLGLDLAAEPVVVHTTRIVRDEDIHFPKDVVRIDFDRGPGGEALADGTDVSEAYVPAGCIFETSVKNSYVGIQKFEVQGRSGGKCAATHKPLYQGTVTVRFCKPGNARLPAGVRYVGFWTAHVSPDGTSLRAFDARDRQIAEIKTAQNSVDFLALTTNVPIAYIQVVPDVAIDPDFAIDDLVFDPPQPLSEAGDPHRYSVVLKTGERLYSQLVRRQRDAVVLEQLSVGAEKIELEAGEIAILVPPRTPQVKVIDDRCYVRLADGSVLRAEGQNGLTLSRLTQTIQPEQLVALWGSETHLLEPPDDAWQEDTALLLREGQPPKAFQNWSLGKEWIETDQLEPMSGPSYANSPSIWFRRPGKRPEQAGLLRTTQGEEFVLDAKTSFRLISWNDEAVVIGKGDGTWTIPMGEVSILLMPTPSR